MKAVVAVSAILLALVGGMIGTTWGMVRAELAREAERLQRQQADNERRRADGEADAARLAQQKAEQNAAVAREQTQLALKSLESVIGDIQDQLSEVPGAGLVRRQILIKALARLREVSKEFALPRKIDRDTALALRRELAEDQKNVQAQMDLSSSFSRMALVEHQTEEFEDAIMWGEKSLAVLRQLDEAGKLAPAYKQRITIVQQAMAACKERRRSP